MNYEEKQAEWLKKHGLKVGSKVKIVREFESETKKIFLATMALHIGKKGAISHISENGISVKCDGVHRRWPYTSLEPVKKKPKTDKEFADRFSSALKLSTEITNRLADTIESMIVRESAIPTDPESTRYEVGKEYEVYDKHEVSKNKRKYAGYFVNTHWFWTGSETLATYAHIREIPSEDPRIGKWCVFSKYPITANSVIVGKIKKAVPPYIEKAEIGLRHCMLLTDFLKMVEDGE